MKKRRDLNKKVFYVCIMSFIFSFILNLSVIFASSSNDMIINNHSNGVLVSQSNAVQTMDDEIEKTDVTINNRLHSEANLTEFRILNTNRVFADLEIRNIGNVDTNEINIVITGPGKDAFKVTPSKIDNLEARNSIYVKFEMLPDVGIGNYEAVISVVGDGINESPSLKIRSGVCAYNVGLYPNNGIDEMYYIYNVYGTFTLPEYTFNLPPSKKFKGWSYEEFDGEVIDADTIEINDDINLFAVYEACTHANVSGVEEVSADCINHGKKAYWYCKTCNQYFEDKDCVTIISNINAYGIVSALGHSFGEWIEEIAPTCIANGVKGHKDCTTCGKHFRKNETEILNLDIPMIEHNYGSDWKHDKDNHYKECVCGKRIENSVHLDDNLDNKCDICGYTFKEVPVEDPITEPFEKSSNGLIIASIVGAVLLVGVVAIVIFTITKKKKNQAK